MGIKHRLRTPSYFAGIAAILWAIYALEPVNTHLLLASIVTVAVLVLFIGTVTIHLLQLKKLRHRTYHLDKKG